MSPSNQEPRLPKLVKASPKYRLHKAYGQAVVTLNGVDRYLGPWWSEASKAKYDRLVGAWLAAGRQPLAQANDALWWSYAPPELWDNARE